MMRLAALLTILIGIAVEARGEATLPTYPTEYNPGDVVPVTATNKSVCATVNITGATNASPIVITTAGHKWVTGQTVVVASVGGNTAANGTRVVTKISATQVALNGTTGNGAYTSGGTAACDYSNLQTALDAEAATGGVTFWLNQGETYAGTAATDVMRSGFILPTKSSTSWTVIRTWDDGIGNLPQTGERVKRKHQPYLAKISNGIQGGTQVQTHITCRKRANYYWIKTIEFTTPLGQAINDGAGCHNEFGGVSGNPPRKWIKNIANLGGGVVAIDVDTGRMESGVFTGYHRLPPGMDIWFECAQCASIGLSGVYTVQTNVNRAIAVTDATNASPIVITTAEEQYWITGQTVVVSSVGGNTAANGTRVVTRISGTQFSLDGTTGNGAYTSGGTVTSPISDRLTISATLTDAYSYNANDNMQIDHTMYPTHIVWEQIMMENLNFSGVSAVRQSVNSAFVISGEDIVVRQSYVDVCGPAGSEYGRGILLAGYGPKRVVIQNNYLAACSFEIFFDANGHILNTAPEDVLVQGNTITRRSSALNNRDDVSTEWRGANTVVKNLLEIKGGYRIRFTGNSISRGYTDDQAIMLHFTNRPNYTVESKCGLPVSGVEGEGCHPGVGVSDIILDHNILMNIGQDCIDLFAQNSRINAPVGSADYPGVRSNRFLVEQNLFLNCGGYPKNFRNLPLKQLLPGSAIVLLNGPQNVTIRHNTMTALEHYGPLRPAIRHFCGPVDNPANGPILNTDGVIRTGAWTACTESAASGHNETGVTPNLTIIDNILWSDSSAFGPYAMAANSAGPVLDCGRSTAFDPGTASTGVWHHNIAVGSVGTKNSVTCDMNVIPGTQVLATGSQIVANQAAMNYLNLPGHVYKLTPSSPGYQAASDGTDVGVNWDVLMAAVTRFK